MRRITECEVCGNPSLIPLLDLGSQPMCDALVPIGSDETPDSFPLELVGCPGCITVHQAVQMEKTRLFPPSYHYRAALTKDVLNGMEELVATIRAREGSLDGKTVLDIGCNDGSLLKAFSAHGALTCGIEPTGAIEDARGDVDWLHHGYFDRRSVETFLAEHDQPDIITFTNVFAHIENLGELLDNVATLMSPNTKLVIENHYLGAVVDLAQFDTFYHEHPRTYSLRSFEVMAERLGRAIELVEFPNRYNGNIRVVIGEGDPASRPMLDEEPMLKGVAAMQSQIGQRREVLQETLSSLVFHHGKLPAKAFPGRATILVHCLGIDESHVDVTYERPSSPKVGHYIPGTRIEIRSEEEFFQRRQQCPVIINFAWHIQQEIEQHMKARGFAGQVFPVWS